MRLSSFVSFIVAVGVTASAILAQDNDVYLSFSGTGQGPASANSAKDFSVGDSGSLFLWIDRDFEVLIGGFVDLITSQPGVIEFQQAAAFNPDVIVLPGEPNESVFGPRWGFVDTPEVAGNQIKDIGGSFGDANDAAVGISPDYDGSGFFLDPLFDSTSNAYLFARIDFSVVGEGATDILFTDLPSDNFNTGFFTTNEQGVIFSPQPSFGIATINAIAVPEPSAAAFLAVGFFWVRLRRTRSKH